MHLIYKIPQDSAEMLLAELKELKAMDEAYEKMSFFQKLRTKHDSRCSEYALGESIQALKLLDMLEDAEDVCLKKSNDGKRYELHFKNGKQAVVISFEATLLGSATDELCIIVRMEGVKVCAMLCFPRSYLQTYFAGEPINVDSVVVSRQPPKRMDKGETAIDFQKMMLGTRY